MTCIAFANTFLNPDLLVAVNVDATSLWWTQVCTFHLTYMYRSTFVRILLTI